QALAGGKVEGGNLHAQCALACSLDKTIGKRLQRCGVVTGVGRADELHMLLAIPLSAVIVMSLTVVPACLPSCSMKFQTSPVSSSFCWSLSLAGIFGSTVRVSSPFCGIWIRICSELSA